MFDPHTTERLVPSDAVQTSMELVAAIGSIATNPWALHYAASLLRNVQDDDDIVTRLRSLIQEYATVCDDDGQYRSWIIGLRDEREPEHSFLRDFVLVRERTRMRNHTLSANVAWHLFSKFEASIMSTYACDYIHCIPTDVDGVYAMLVTLGKIACGFTAEGVYLMRNERLAATLLSVLNTPHPDAESVMISDVLLTMSTFKTYMTATFHRYGMVECVPFLFSNDVSISVSTCNILVEWCRYDVYICSIVRVSVWPHMLCPDFYRRVPFSVCRMALMFSEMQPHLPISYELMDSFLSFASSHGVKIDEMVKTLVHANERMVDTFGRTGELGPHDAQRWVVKNFAIS